MSILEGTEIMHRLLRAGILATFGMLSMCLIGGCAGDDLTGTVDGSIRTNLVATIPEHKGIVSAAGELKMFFDSSPKSVTVDGIPAIIQDNTAIVKITDLPKVSPGNVKTVTIKWSNPGDSAGGAASTSFTAIRPAVTVIVNPLPGSEIHQDETEFTLKFDVEVLTARVNDTSAFGSRLTWKVSPELTLGTEQSLYVRWSNPDGSYGFMEVGPYTVRPPRPDGLPATDVSVTPQVGSIVPSYQEFALSFDGIVTAATANGIAATGARRTWTVTPFIAAQGGRMLTVDLTITWTNRDGSSGTKNVGTYVVPNPDPEPPTIIHGTVRDGDIGVDPVPINAGGFRFDFNEPVIGTVILTDKAGVHLRWHGSVVRQLATLTAEAGQELVNGTTYKIEIDVRDRSHNRTQVTITFVTKVK